jgi:hypothetical protein
LASLLSKPSGIGFVLMVFYVLLDNAKLCHDWMLAIFFALLAGRLTAAFQAS